MTNAGEMKTRTLVPPQLSEADRSCLDKARESVHRAMDILTEALHAVARVHEMAEEAEQQRGFSEARKAALTFALQSLQDAVLTEDGLDGADGMRAIEIVEEAIQHGTFDCLKRGRAPTLCLMEDFDRMQAQRDEIGKAMLHLRRDLEKAKLDVTRLDSGCIRIVQGHGEAACATLFVQRDLRADIDAAVGAVLGE